MHGDDVLAEPSRGRPPHTTRAELVLARQSVEPLARRQLEPDPLQPFASALNPLQPADGDRVQVYIDLLPASADERRRLHRRLYRKATRREPAESAGGLDRLLEGDRRRALPVDLAKRRAEAAALDAKLKDAGALFRAQVLIRCHAAHPARARTAHRSLLAAFEQFADRNWFRVVGLLIPGVAFAGSDLPLRRRWFDHRADTGLFRPARRSIVTAREIAAFLKPPTRHCSAQNVLRAGVLVGPPPDLPGFDPERPSRDVIPLGRVASESGSHLVGTLPWGYVRDRESGLAVPDPDRAPLVLELFERYATGQHSDLELAAWLNAKGARTARGRPFGKDTVREMLVNAAYCGYVTALRSKDRSIRGLHEPIVPEELFDRVQEIRGWRTRIVKPGPPSEDYLLRKLLYCEHCGARMHGSKGSRGRVRRYQCSTRRYGGDCPQPIVQAEPLEEQIVDWLRDFQPDDELRTVVLSTIQAEARRRGGEEPDRRRELLGQLERLQDLYVMGDLAKAQYVMHRQALEDEVQRIGPPTDPRLDQAEALLADFARFWDAEPAAIERRKLLAALVDGVWADGDRIVAVKPQKPFRPYFEAARALAHERGANSGSDGT